MSSLGGFLTALPLHLALQAPTGPLPSWYLKMDLVSAPGSLTTLGTSDLVSARGAPPPAQLTPAQTGRKAAQVPGELCVSSRPRLQYAKTTCPCSPSSFSNHCLGIALPPTASKARSRPLTAHVPPPSGDQAWDRRDPAMSLPRTLRPLQTRGPGFLVPESSPGSLPG